MKVAKMCPFLSPLLYIFFVGFCDVRFAAGTVVVVVSSQSYPGGIKAAISTVPNGGTLQIAAGIYSGSSNCGLTIISTNMSIVAPDGPQSTILDCGSSTNRLLTIVNSTVDIQGFQVVAANLASAIPTDFSFSNSTAPSTSSYAVDKSDYYGGGILVMGNNSTDSARLTVTNCIMVGGMAIRGGQISAIDGASLSVASSSFKHGVALQGGSIFHSGASCSIISSSFLNCSSSGKAFPLNVGDATGGAIAVMLKSATTTYTAPSSTSPPPGSTSAAASNNATTASSPVDLDKSARLDVVMQSLTVTQSYSYASSYGSANGGSIAIQWTAQTSSSPTKITVSLGTISIQDSYARATNTAAYGGAIYLALGSTMASSSSSSSGMCSLILNNIVISNSYSWSTQSSSAGGALFVVIAASKNPYFMTNVQFTSSSFTSNYVHGASSASGGSIWISATASQNSSYSSANLQLSGLTVSQSAATATQGSAQGGGLAISTAVSSSSSTTTQMVGFSALSLSSCTATSKGSVQGGGLYTSFTAADSKYSSLAFSLASLVVASSFVSSDRNAGGGALYLYLNVSQSTNMTTNIDIINTRAYASGSVSNNGQSSAPVSIQMDITDSKLSNTTLGVSSLVVSSSSSSGMDCTGGGFGLTTSQSRSESSLLSISLGTVSIIGTLCNGTMSAFGGGFSYSGTSTSSPYDQTIIRINRLTLVNTTATSVVIFSKGGGAAVAFVGDSSDYSKVDVTMHNSTITKTTSRSSVQAQGGGIYLDAGHSYCNYGNATILITDTVFDSTTSEVISSATTSASALGGAAVLELEPKYGVFFHGYLEMKRCIVTKCAAIIYPSTFSEGITLSSVVSAVTSMTSSGSSGTGPNGGNGGKPAERVSSSSDPSNARGGGVLMEAIFTSCVGGNMSVSLEDSVVSDCWIMSLVEASAGGVYIDIQGDSNHYMTMKAEAENLSIINCGSMAQNSQSLGGGLYLSSRLTNSLNAKASYYLNDSMVTGCSTSSPYSMAQGGAMYLSFTQRMVNDSDVMGDSFWLYRSVIDSNTAMEGSALYVKGGQSYAGYSVISNNIGCAYVISDSLLSATSMTVKNNQGVTLGGAFLLQGASQMSLSNSSIAGNKGNQGSSLMTTDIRAVVALADNSIYTDTDGVQPAIVFGSLSMNRTLISCTSMNTGITIANTSGIFTASCKVCGVGGYSMDVADNSNLATCHACPYAGICENGTVYSTPGFWGLKSSVDGSVTFFQCYPGLCCPLTATRCDYNYCPGNRVGKMCTNCPENHGTSFFSVMCRHQSACNDMQWAMPLMVVGSFIVSLWLFRTTSNASSGMMNVIVFYYQAMPLIKSTPWTWTPPALLSVIRTVFLMSPFESMSPGGGMCLFPGMTPAWENIARLLFEGVVMCSIVGLFTLHKLALKVGLKLPGIRGVSEGKTIRDLLVGEDEDDEITDSGSNSNSNITNHNENGGAVLPTVRFDLPKRKKSYLSEHVGLRYAMMTVRLGCICYTSILLSCLQCLQCVYIDNVNYWYRDTSIKCYQQFQIIAMVVFGILGPIPFLMILMLLRWKEPHRLPAWKRQVERTLGSGFTHERRWWLGVTLYRQMWLVLAYSMIVNLAWRSIATTTLCVLFLMIHLVAKPYARQSTQNTETVSLVLLCLLSATTAPQLAHQQFGSLIVLIGSDALEWIQFILVCFPAFFALAIAAHTIYLQFKGFATSAGIYPFASSRSNVINNVNFISEIQGLDFGGVEDSAQADAKAGWGIVVSPPSEETRYSFELKDKVSVGWELAAWSKSEPE